MLTLASSDTAAQPSLRHTVVACSMRTSATRTMNAIMMFWVM